MELLPTRIIYRFTIPQKCALFVRGKKNCCILCSQLVLHIKPEVTALSFQVHTVDSWALQMCVRIKAKSFMMDDITDNNTVMGWKYGLNMQMVGVTQMVSPMEQSEAALV